MKSRVLWNIPTMKKLSSSRFKFIFGEDSIDELSKDELGKIFIKGWHREYLNTQTRKGNFYVPVTVVIPTKDADNKALEVLKKPFVVIGENLYEYPIVVNMVNGSERTTITYDDLSDDEKEMVDYGFISLQECIREHGGTVYGERVREFRYLKPGRGFGKGVVETRLTVDEVKMKPLETEETGLPFDEEEI